MSLEEGLKSALTADGTVNGLVSGRIYPELMPDDVTYPAISYQRISTVRRQFLTGVDDFTQVRIQVDCWDSSYSGVKTLAAAVKSAIDGVRALGSTTVHHCFMETMADLSEFNGDRHDRRIAMDFIVYLDE